MPREYTPNGNGTQTGTACAHCGCQTFLLDSDVPECLNCFTINEAAVMAAERIGGGLEVLVQLVRDLPPTTKAVLRNDTEDWLSSILRVVSEVQS